MNEDLQARIRTRAYQLWENDPSPNKADADEYWEKALRQLEAEGDPEQNAPAASSEQSDKYNHLGIAAEERDPSEQAPDS